MILTLIDHGLTPCPFFEGNHTQRLEYYADLPKGKILGFFDSTDIHRAKDILGKTMCRSGFMPLLVLQTGTEDDVKTQAKRLIDVLGKDGGFIMGPRSAMDEADPRLVKAWFDFTKEYGVYA
jgi:uroporphyrinogen-III decarboxylase